MLTNFGAIVVGLAILITLLSALGVSMTTLINKSKAPRWQCFDKKRAWNSFFDSRPWLKLIIIRAGQGLIIIILLFSNIFLSTLKAMLKKMGGSAKKK